MAFIYAFRPTHTHMPVPWWGPSRAWICIAYGGREERLYAAFTAISIGFLVTLHPLPSPFTIILKVLPSRYHILAFSFSSFTPLILTISATLAPALSTPTLAPPNLLSFLLPNPLPLSLLPPYICHFRSHPANVYGPSSTTHAHLLISTCKPLLTSSLPLPLPLQTLAMSMPLPLQSMSSCNVYAPANFFISSTPSASILGNVYAPSSTTHAFLPMPMPLLISFSTLPFPLQPLPNAHTSAPLKPLPMSMSSIDIQYSAPLHLPCLAPPNFLPYLSLFSFHYLCPSLLPPPPSPIPLHHFPCTFYTVKNR
jgi:hypothetical protein